jgi:hypothetical protein
LGEHRRHAEITLLQHPGKLGKPPGTVHLTVGPVPVWIAHFPVGLRKIPVTLLLNLPNPSFPTECNLLLGLPEQPLVHSDRFSVSGLVLPLAGIDPVDEVLHILSVNCRLLLTDLDIERPGAREYAGLAHFRESTHQEPSGPVEREGRCQEGSLDTIVFNFLDDNTVLDNLDRFERFPTQIRSPDVRRKKGALGTPSPPQEIRYLHDTRNGIQRQSSNRAARVGVHSRNSVFMSRMNSSSDSTVCCRGLCRALPFG